MKSLPELISVTADSTVVSITVPEEAVRRPLGDKRQMVNLTMAEARALHRRLQRAIAFIYNKRGDYIKVEAQAASPRRRQHP